MLYIKHKRITMEVWKDIKGFEANYQISNKGRVRSKARKTKNQYGDEFIKTTGTYTSAGYEVHNLYLDGKYKTVSVHRLVAEHFVDGYFNGAVVNHIDGDKTNNASSNLEWCTRSENQKHAVENGLWKVSDKHIKSAKKQGKAMGKANQKVDKNTELNILIDLVSMTGKAVAEKYGISQSTVSWIKNRKGNYAD